MEDEEEDVDQTAIETKTETPSALAQVVAQVRGRRGQLLEELPRHLTPERMLALAVGEFRRNPQLNECSPASLISAIVDAGRLGLEVDHHLGRAYIVPRRDRQRGMEATLVVGYKGLLDLAYRSGMVIAIDTAAVYEGDKFYWVLGTNPELKHRPQGTDRGQAKLTHAYAVARLTTGGAIFEVMDRSEIEAIRTRSRSGSSGPWSTDYSEMARKTALRRLCKRLPMSVDMRDAGATLARAVEVDEAYERGEQPFLVVEQIGDDPVCVVDPVAKAEERPSIRRGHGGALTERQLNAINAMSRSLGWTRDVLRQHCIDSFEVGPEELTHADASAFIVELQKLAVRVDDRPAGNGDERAARRALFSRLKAVRGRLGWSEEQLREAVGLDPVAVPLAELEAATAGLEQRATEAEV
jgi:recombination protein RecT